MLIRFSDNNKNSKLLKNILKDFTFNSVSEFRSKYGLPISEDFDEECFEVLYRLVLEPIKVNFSDYYKEENKKNQIVWHHSAGRDNAKDMFYGWENDDRGRVATSIGITDDGYFYRGFDEKYWAHHLGIKASNNTQLNKNSVAVEICNGGYLEKKDGAYKTWFNQTIENNKISKLEKPFRGYTHFEKYTNKEIVKLKYWTLLMALRFSIDLTFRYSDMFSSNVSQRALNGENGIFTHCSFREDKTDLHPQIELIQMAKELEKYQN